MRQNLVAGCAGVLCLLAGGCSMAEERTSLDVAGRVVSESSQPIADASITLSRVTYFGTYEELRAVTSNWSGHYFLKYSDDETCSEDLLMMSASAPGFTTVMKG